MLISPTAAAAANRLIKNLELSKYGRCGRTCLDGVAKLKNIHDREQAIAMPWDSMFSYLICKASFASGVSQRSHWRIPVM
jgi:hypothetical protein